MKSLNNYREKEFIGVAELVKAAKDVLESSEIQQGSRIVAQFPNQRTVRYYLSEELIPPADYAEGTASVFTYRHLLTLILIKHLQSQGMPIKIIKRILPNRSITELEKLFNEPVAVTTDINQAQIAEMHGEEVVIISNPKEVREILDSPLGKSSSAQKLELGIWERFQVAYGIELHISQSLDFDKRKRRRLVRDIKSLLLSKMEPEDDDT